MKKAISRFLAALLLSVTILTVFAPSRAEAAVGKPVNLKFYQWANTQYTRCSFTFQEWYYVDGYQTRLTWTDGSHAQYLSWDVYNNSNLYNEVYLGGTINVTYNHVQVLHIRAYNYDSNGRKVYSAWSNATFITPWPRGTTMSSSVPNKKKPEIRLKWKPVYGSNGYNVFLTTNPYGTWTWNQSTAVRATATSALIKSYRGSKLKTNQNYYVRVITRRKYNGVFCTVPAPSSSYFAYRFRLSK